MIITELFTTGVCKIYEEYLETLHPSKNNITYYVEDLIDFIEDIPDILCMVYQKDTGFYAPHKRDWIKEQVYLMLKKKGKKAETD